MQKLIEIELPPDEEDLFLRISSHKSIIDILNEDIFDCIKKEEHKKRMWVDVDRFENNRRLHSIGVVPSEFAVKYFCIGILIAQINNLILRLDNFYNKKNKLLSEQIGFIQYKLMLKNTLLDKMKDEMILSIFNKRCKHDMILIIFIDEFRVYVPHDYCYE